MMSEKDIVIDVILDEDAGMIQEQDITESTEVLDLLSCHIKPDMPTNTVIINNEDDDDKSAYINKFVDYLKSTSDTEPPCIEEESAYIKSKLPQSSFKSTFKPAKYSDGNSSDSSFVEKPKRRKRKRGRPPINGGVQIRIHCSLCKRNCLSHQVHNGHALMSPYSKFSLAKVLVLSVQAKIRVPKENWNLCTYCLHILQEADEYLVEQLSIQKKLEDMKKRLMHLLNLKVSSEKPQLAQSTVQIINSDDEENKPPEPEDPLKPPSVLNAPVPAEEKNTKLACPLCNRSMARRTLKKHIEKIHVKQVSIVCSACMMTIANEAEFADHMLTYHPAGTKLEEVAYESDIQRGITKRLKNKPLRIPCPVCGTVFDRYYMRSHINTVHLNITDLIYPCRYCSEKFSKKSHRLAHVRQVHPHNLPQKDLIQCQYCFKSYRGHLLLKYHINKVHMEKQMIHKCEFCSKTFSEKYLLSLHRRTHTNERPFLCKVCNKYFKSSSECRRHIRRVHKMSLQYRINDPFNADRLPMAKVSTANREVIRTEEETTEEYSILVEVLDS